MHRRLNIVPLALMALTGFLLFALELKLAGYGALAASLISAYFVDRALLRDLSLVAVGVFVISLAPINPSVETKNVLAMGPALVAAIALPYLISRRLYKNRVVEFPFHFKEAWTRNKWLYMTFVLVASFLLLPWYLITSGAYMNWPAADTTDTIFRLFIGTNVVGIWDELFFICIVLGVFRRHLPFWQANLLQAVIFTSFLYELGFTSFGPLLTFPFALAQGYVFKRSGNLFYVICVHLLLDFILFLTLIHAHNREFLPIFLY
jgi:membrane protease YdiL (CAAX protease family)